MRPSRSAPMPAEPPASLRARTIAAPRPDRGCRPRHRVTPIAHERTARAPGAPSGRAGSRVLARGGGCHRCRRRPRLLRVVAPLPGHDAPADGLHRVGTRPRRLRGELASARRESARLTNTVGVLGAPDLLRVDLRGASAAPRAIGRAFLSRAHGLVFAADGLPVARRQGTSINSGSFPKAAGPVSAGVFGVDPAGSSNMSLPLPACSPRRPSRPSP